jgi:hypothetical protein
MGHAEQPFNASLEILNQGTVVGQPPALDDIGRGFQQAIAIANVGLANVQWFRERGSRAIDCEIVNAVNGFHHRIRAVRPGG